MPVARCNAPNRHETYDVTATDSRYPNGPTVVNDLPGSTLDVWLLVFRPERSTTRRPEEHFGPSTPSRRTICQNRQKCWTRILVPSDFLSERASHRSIS